MGEWPSQASKTLDDAVNDIYQAITTHQACYLPILFCIHYKVDVTPVLHMQEMRHREGRLSNLLQVPPPERGGARSEAQVRLTPRPLLFSVLHAAMLAVTRCNVDSWGP